MKAANMDKIGIKVEDKVSVDAEGLTISSFFGQMALIFQPNSSTKMPAKKKNRPFWRFDYISATQNHYMHYTTRNGLVYT